jgi:hypothetical protein
MQGASMKLSPDQMRELLAAMKKTIRGMGEAEQSRFISRTAKRLDVEFNLRAWLFDDDETPAESPLPLFEGDS